MRFVPWVFLFLALTALAVPVLADPPAEKEGDATPRPIRLTGCISKDNSAEFATFDLQLGNDLCHYQVKGTTRPDQGILQTDSNFRGVEVSKRSNEDGLTRLRYYDNEGTVKIFLRRRQLEGVKLAGVTMEGEYIQKLFTNSLSMDGLRADAQRSRGRLFYNIATGIYSCPAGQCQFGRYGIQSTLPGRRIVLNYDDFINQKRLRVSMQFGDLLLNGEARFTDTTRTTGSGDTTITTVVATRGCFNVDVTKGQGAVRFAAHQEAATEDDATARHLLAWIELMAYDLLSE